MGIVLTLKEGGSLLIDTIGGLPLDEDIDLLFDITSAVGLGVMKMGVGSFGI
jgi:hypothetical protein